MIIAVALAAVAMGRASSMGAIGKADSLHFKKGSPATEETGIEAGFAKAREKIAEGVEKERTTVKMQNGLRGTGIIERLGFEIRTVACGKDESVLTLADKSGDRFLEIVVVDRSGPVVGGETMVDGKSSADFQNLELIERIIRDAKEKGWVRADSQLTRNECSPP